MLSTILNTKQLSGYEYYDKNSNLFWNTNLHHGPITLIKNIKNFIISCSNDQIKVFKINGQSCLISDKLFNSQRIYGLEYVELSDSKFLLSLQAGKMMRIVLLEINEKENKYQIINTSKILYFKDWILNFKQNIINNQIEWHLSFSNGFIGNIKLEIDLDNLHFNQIKDAGAVLIPKKCLLYSSCFIENNIVASGTVFNEILIWDYSKNNNNMGKLLARLKGHEGVIFGIDYYAPNQILASTSDDRTIRIWELENLNNENELNLLPIITIYGHVSRVWKVNFINQNYLISISEDNTAKLWKYDLIERSYECKNTFKANWGKNLWSVDVSKDNDKLFVGGNDGALVAYNLKSYFNDVKEEPLKISLNQEEKDSIWSFVILDKDLILVTTKNGVIWIYELKQNTIIQSIKLFQDEELKGYSIIDFLKFEEYYVAVIGSKKGCVFTLLINRCFEFKFNKFMCHQDRIEKLNLFKNFNESNTFFIISKQVNINYINLNTFKIHDNIIKETELIKNIELPKKFTLTCIHMDQYNRIILGSRNGSIAFYNEHFILENVFINIHNKETVSFILSLNQHVYTAGRDGAFNKFNFNNNVELIKQAKITKGWIEKLELFNDQIIAVIFYQKKIQLVNLDTNQNLLNVFCGGAHRIWYSQFKDNTFLLGYIEKHNILFNQLDINNYIKLLPSLHGREIRTANILNQYILTGAEDGILKLNTIENNQLHMLDSNKRHESVITDISNCNEYIFSVGANQNLLCWKIIYDKLLFLNSADKIGNILEVRIMKVLTYDLQDKVLITLAYSDGHIRMFYYYCLKNEFEFISESLINPIKCILSLELIKSVIMKDELNLIFCCGTTCGRIHFLSFNVNQHKINHLFSHIVHQSGINSLKVVNKNKQIVTFSVGDDNHLKVNVFNLEGLDIEFIKQINHDFYHVSSIQDIQIQSINDINYIYTVSSDNRITKFQYDGEIRYIHSQIGDVVDPSTLLLDNKKLYCFGVGMQGFDVE